MKRLLILAAMCVALTACDMKPWPPFADHGACLVSRTDIVLTPMPSGVGLGFDLGGGIQLVPMPQTVCEQHEFPNGDGPNYQAGMKRYAAELQAWYERHPEGRP